MMVTILVYRRVAIARLLPLKNYVFENYRRRVICIRILILICVIHYNLINLIIFIYLIFKLEFQI